MNTKRCVSLARSLILTAMIPAFLLLACGNKDRNFVRDASISNVFEVMSSEMAVQRSQNPQVRQFAQRMIDDHTAAGNQLKAIATAPNSGLPQPETALDSKHQGMMDTLTQATDFDRQYVDLQAQAHDSAILLFSDYAKNGGNDALKRFAADTLPVLQDHAQSLASLRSGLTTAPGTVTPPEGTTAPMGTTPEGTTVPEGTPSPNGTITPGTTSPGGTLSPGSTMPEGTTSPGGAP